MRAAASLVRLAPRAKPDLLQLSLAQPHLCHSFTGHFTKQRNLSQFTLMRLPCRMTAIYPQVRPCHERAGIADQEHGCATVLLGSGQSAQHVLCRPCLLALRVLDEQLLDHLRYDISGRDGVDTNVVLTPFGRKVSSELDDTCLGRVVCGADQALAYYQ
jgi:hypothetical protein